MPHTAVLCCKKQQQQQQQQTTPRAQQYTSNLLIPCAPGKPNVKHHRTTPKPEIHITVVEKEPCWRENRAPKRIQAAKQQCEYVFMYTIEAHFLKPGAYGGSVRVWGNAWDVFRRTPSRGGRGRRAAVECFECGGISFFFFSFSLLRMHTACSKYETPLPHLSLQ